MGLGSTLKLLGADNSASFEVFAREFESARGQPDARPGANSEKAAVSENRFVIVANSAATAKIALTLVTARVRPGADNREASAGDNAEYRAKPRFDHDLDGHLIFVSVYHRDSPAGARPHFGLTRYAWNRG